ncbi:hypothetical protein CAC42_5755 [Sphaceloma murrayae]|uniref:Uncharacterized protein n=1 Tax=Sphaceloma murrayae TaxID=2082308 RepID=A0A2K1QZ25_9PEZI|nr:hypothetical protein CAC42_5755 [Sphaceloma murrayae]
MDFLQDSTPTYYIYRDGSSNEPFDPTAPLQFFPPKDSDELFFALRNAFPHVATHSERMRNAVIDFLMQEGQAQQANSTQTSPLMPLDSGSFDSASASPYSSYIPMTSSSSSSWSSPHLSATSPAITHAETSQTSQSSLDQMTTVFSLTSHTQPKLRTRRKMTEVEKAEYRKRRSAGACQSCSSRKRKCKHNKDASASASIPPASASAGKLRVVKPLTKKQGKQVVPALPAPSVPMNTASNPAECLTSFDNSNAFTGDLLSFDDTELFPLQRDADWALLDELENEPEPRFWGHGNPYALEGEHTATSDVNKRHRTHSFNSGAISSASQLERTSISRSGVSNISQQNPGHSDEHVLDGGFSWDIPTSPQSPMHTSHVHAALSPGAQLSFSNAQPRSNMASVQERLPYQDSSGSGPSGGSGTRRGDVDRGHDYAPTRVSTITFGSSGSGIYGFDADTRSQSSGSSYPGDHTTALGPRPLMARSRQDTLDRSHMVLPIGDAFATASVQERQSLAPRNSVQKISPTRSPQDSPGIPRGNGLPMPTPRRVAPQAPAGSDAETAVHADSNRSRLPPSSSSISPTIPQDVHGLGFATESSSTSRLSPSEGVRAPSEARNGPPILFTDSLPLLSFKSTSGSDLDDNHLGTSLSLEAYLKQIGEIRWCLLCSLLSSLPRVRVESRYSAKDNAVDSKPISCMDDLAGLCGRLQIAAC